MIFKASGAGPILRTIYKKLYFLPFFYLCIFIGTTCITQDDYATLSELTTNGYLGPAEGVWSGLGGNISSVLPRTLALKFSIFPNLPFGQVLYSGFTFLLVLLAFDHLFSQLLKQYAEFPLRARLFFLIILGLGFEGIFTPGEIGVLGFSAAAGVHIWPICLMVLVDKFLAEWKFSTSTFTLIAICYSTNANVPESLLSILILIGLALRFFFKGNLVRKRREILRITILVILAVICFSAIFIAPGFAARSKSVGVNFDPQSIVIGLVRAFLFFGADILSHPFLYLALVAGLILGKNLRMNVSRVYFCQLSLVAATYFLILVIGAGIAYPAWHQTLGLYVLLLPLSFTCGVALSNHPKFHSFTFKRVTVFLVMLCLIVTIRSGYLVVERKVFWAAHFENNVCVVLQRQNDPFVGSEITYPPKNLGVEDLNTWTWMADGFSNWINGSDYSCRE